MRQTVKLNREFAVRYLFVALLMLGLGGWFGYDGFVRYPSLPAATLYADCHGGEAPVSAEAAEKFRATAIPRQKQFMALSLLASFLVGACLVRAVRFRFSWDETGFAVGDRRYTFAEIVAVETKRWEKKGILVLRLPAGAVTLDAWHHAGVEAFRARLKAEGKID